MMLFFLSGMIEGQLLSTGAFEVSFNGETKFSLWIRHFVSFFLLHIIIIIITLTHQHYHCTAYVSANHLSPLLDAEIL